MKIKKSQLKKIILEIMREGEERGEDIWRWQCDRVSMNDKHADKLIQIMSGN